MEIYLVRHGESQSNYDNKHGYLYFCGQLDVPLTERGIKSAKELSVYFKNKYIDNVYVSDLKRTRQTYEELFPYDIPTIYTKTLRERSLGVFEGKNKEEVCKDKRFEKYFRDPNYKYFRHSFSQKAPQGESYQDVYDRVVTFIENELNQQQRRVVIVAHQVVIRCFFVYFKMITKEEALSTEIHNCYPYLIKKEMKF